MPLQASIRHGSRFMHVYPFAQFCLDQVLKDPQHEGGQNDPKSVWSQFMGLLSALDHIHDGRPEQYGYHFDLVSNWC